MKLKAKILTLVLALAMLFSIIAVLAIPAGAAESDSGQTIYFAPTKEWEKDGARFAAYFFNDSGNTWVDMTKVENNLGVEGGLYKVNVPAGYPKVIFCRMNGATTANNWDNRWNQTVNIELPNNDNNFFTITVPYDNGAHSALGEWTQATFSVVGAETLGANWTQSDSSNDMTLQDDGTYKKGFSGVPSGNHDIKIIFDHDWVHQWGDASVEGGNYTVNVEHDNSNVVVTFDPKTGEISVDSLILSVPEGVSGATINSDGTLPAAGAPDGYTFVGWSETTVADTTAKPEDLLLANTVYSGDKKILFAVYEHGVTEGFKKVTAAKEDYSGTYLIVYGAGSLAFDGSLETIDATGNSISVTISEGVIAYSDELSKSTFVISAVDGGYTIKSYSGWYLDRTETSNGMDEDKKTAGKNTISVSNGNAVITSTGGPTLQYYKSGSNSRFRYYASSQNAIQLYEHVSGSTSYLTLSDCTHDYGEGVETTPATCTKDGEKTFTCSICGDNYKEVIEKTGHNYVDGVCSACDAVQPTSLVINRDNFGEASDYAWHTWTGTTTTGDSISGSGFIYGTTTSSIQVNGSKTGDYIYNTTALPGKIVSITLTKESGKTDRNFAVLTSDTPFDSATAASLKSDTRVADAKKLVTEDGVTWTFDETNHKYFAIVIVDKNAAYLSSIEIVYEKTSTCAHANTGDIGEAKAATCTENGITAGEKCKDCGTIITPQETIPATGHTYVDGVCSCGDREKVAVLVTDASLLKAGDQIFVVCTGNAVAMGAQNGSYRNTVSVTFTNNTMTIIDGAQVITLGGSEGAWTLGVSDTEYLYWDSGNDVKTGTTAYAWNIAIESDGIATISSVETPERELQYNASSPRFACYTGTQQDISIYKVVDMNCEHTSGGAATCDKAETCTKCGITLNPATGNHTYENHVCKECKQDDPEWYFIKTITEAIATEDGKKVQVAGVVSSIDYAWNDSNMSVYITDSTGAELYLYKLQTEVAVGDVIIVKGAMSTYNDRQISYATATAGTILYFENNWLWSAPYYYYWIGEGSEKVENDTWPGIPLTEVVGQTDKGYDIYKIVIPSDVTGLIFNGNNEQSTDTKGPFNSCDCYYMSYNDTTDKKDAIPYSRHNWNDGEITKEATCAVNGNKKYTCTDCGSTKNETIAATGNHTLTLVEKAEVTCLNDGHYAYNQCSVCDLCFVIDPEATGEPTGATFDVFKTIEKYYFTQLGHSYTGAYVSDNKTHSQLCVNGCGQPGEAVDHTEETIPGYAATCTEAGLSDGKKCTVCGTVTVEQNTIDATGHTEKEIPAVAATCTTAGSTAGTKCSVCETVITAPKTVDAKGHTEVEIPAVAATCTTAGATAGTKCSVCETVIKAPETVDAIGHTWTNDNYTDPTFEADGYWTCANNGCSETKIDADTKLIAVAQVGENKYQSLQEAIDAASNGATVKLLKDITLEETITIAKGNTLVLDLAGKTIAGTDGKASSNFELIANKGTLTINDSVGGGAITLTSTTDRDWNAYSAVIANLGGTLTIEGGKVHHLGGTDMAYAIDNNSTLGNTVLTINGGEVLSTNYRAVRLFANSTTHTNSVTVNGGTVKGGSAALGNNAWSTAIWMQNPNANANNASLTVGADAKVGSVNVYSTGDTSGLKLSVASEALIQDDPEGVASVLNNTTDENYEIKEIDGKFVIAKVPAAAKVNGNEYVTLQAAIDAAGKGDVITVLRDVTEKGTEVETGSGEFFIQILNKEVVIDLGGYTLKGSLYLNSGAKLTIDNGSIETLAGNKSSCIESVGGSIVLGEKLSAYSSIRHAIRVKGGTAVINGGTYKADGNSTYHVVNISHASTVIINGGTFTSNKGNSISGGNAVMIQDKASVVEIYGGIFQNASGVEGCICASDGLKLYGGKFDTWTYDNYLADDKCKYTVGSYYEVKDHTSVTDAAVAPTCTKTGLTEGSHCSNCSKVLVKQEVVDALGHTSVTDKAKDPTCTETGLTAGSHCSVCNETLVAQEEVPATGHTYVKGECANGCGDKKYIETEGAVVSGHSNVAELLEALKSNSALAENFEIVLPEGVELVVKLTKVDGVTKLVFDVAPMKGDAQEALGNKITFRLPVPAAVTTTHAHVYHEGIWIGTYEIKGEGNSKYVELSAKDFSEYSLEFVNAVAMVGDFGYETLGEALDKVAAGDTVKLVADITLTDTITLSKAITLDGNGHTITSTADVAITVTAEDITINNLTVNVAASKFAISIYRSAYVNADFNLAEGADIISGEISDKAGVKVYFKNTYKELLATRGFLTSEAENGMLLLGTRLSYYIGSNGNWYFNNEDTGHKAVATDGATPEIGENGNWWIGGVDTGTKAEAVNGATPTIGENGNWWIGEVDTGTKATSQIPYIKDGYWYIDGEKTEHSAQGVDGKTPYIGENGNWWVGETDLDVSAKGQDGETPTFKIENGNLYAKFPSDKDWTPLGTVVGADGKTPEFKIENDVLHVSYDNGTSWTPLGNIAGADGEDGKTPEFKIDEATGNLMVSYDDGETWKEVGIVVGTDGEDGKTPTFKIDKGVLYVSYDNGTSWTPLGNIAGADGEDGKTPKFDIDAKGNLIVSYDDGKTWEEVGIVVGANGEDGKTPTFKIDKGVLYVSYDNGPSWSTLGDVAGEDGSDGKTPKFDIDANGNLIVSYDDGKTWEEVGIVVGTDGEDGKTPTFKIDKGVLYVSYDNGTSWSKLGNIAGADGKTPKFDIDANGNLIVSYDDGETWKEVGIVVGTDGEDGKTPTFKIDEGVLYVSYDNGTSWSKLGDVAGEDGADGKDGITPKFELRGKELFVSYDNGTTWTSLGQIAGADGSDGSDGADGKTPKFKIENDYLWVSYDEGTSWTKLDKVTGEDGATGASGITPKFEIKGGNLMISYDNGSTWASLGNVLGSDGAAGAAGITPTIGENGCWIIGGVQTELPSRGNDGQSPHIGDNGNWFIGNNDLGVPARGQDGKTPSFRIENGNLQVSFGEDVWQDLGRVVGENGLTPVIGENGNWWLGDLDTGVSASGANGATPHIGENGNWWIGNTDTGVKAIGRDGNDNNKIVLISIGIAALCICVTVIAVATATRRRPWWILT